MIYICGPMTGYPLLNLKRFEEVRGIVEIESGDAATIPHDIIPSDTPYDDALIRSIIFMLQCDDVYFMNGWRHSNGASIEHAIAEMTKKHIVYETEGGYDAVFGVSENKTNS